jgi:hypothetical protein
MFFLFSVIPRPKRIIASKIVAIEDSRHGKKVFDFKLT